METPFREPGVDPSPVAASDALAKLESAEEMPIVSQLAFFGVKEFEIVAGDPIAEPALRAEAETLHFTYFGNFSRVSDEENAKHRECWIDDTTTVLVTLRSAEEKVRLDPGRQGLGDSRSARYTLTTMFHDGSVVSTTMFHDDSALSTANRLAQRSTFDKRLHEHDGSDDLAIDYAEHTRPRERAFARGSSRAPDCGFCNRAAHSGVGGGSPSRLRVENAPRPLGRHLRGFDFHRGLDLRPLYARALGNALTTMSADFPGIG